MDRKEIEIPEGYEAKIEGNKVVFELKESEDERMREHVVLVVKDWWRKIAEVTDDGKWPTEEEMLAYLEKQKDEAQRQFNLGIQAGKEEAMYEMEKEQRPSTPEDIAAAYQMGLAEGRKEQKPAEWSEEDEQIFNQLILRMDGHHYTYEVLQSMKRWLQERMKLLRPWKPSEEQMETLEHYLVTLTDTKNKEVLFGLYNDLKKL